MEIGQIVDYCIEFNEAHGIGKQKQEDANRAATQADWDLFWG